MGSVPGLGQPPGEGNGYPLQDSCLENPVDIIAAHSLPLFAVPRLIAVASLVVEHQL